MTPNTIKPVSDAVLASVAAFLEIEPQRVGRKSPRFAATPGFCAHCGKELDFFDFVTTAFESGEHSKEFMVRFLDSNLSMGRTLPVALTCSACHGQNQVTVSYYYDDKVCGR
ncbi:hypothetical protein [Sinorhizobium meliloti]